MVWELKGVVRESALLSFVFRVVDGCGIRVVMMIEVLRERYFVVWTGYRLEVGRFREFKILVGVRRRERRVLSVFNFLYKVVLVLVFRVKGILFYLFVFF